MNAPRALLFAVAVALILWSAWRLARAEAQIGGAGGVRLLYLAAGVAGQALLHWSVEHAST